MAVVEQLRDSLFKFKDFVSKNFKFFSPFHDDFYDEAEEKVPFSGADHIVLCRASSATDKLFSRMFVLICGFCFINLTPLGATLAEI